MNRTWQKVSFFASLYFIQGAVFAYAVNFQKPFLVGRGLPLSMVGLFTSLLLVPFMLKIVFGLVSDRMPVGRWGSRKPYMVAGLGLFSLCYGCLGNVDPAESFGLFTALSFTASSGLALFDTCCDGWAIDVARAEEQGPIQAAMVSGRSVGFVTMSVGFGVLAQGFGFAVIFQALAVMAVGMLFAVAVMPYRPLGGQLEPALPGLAELWRSLEPAQWTFALYGVLYSISSFGTDGLLTVHLTESRLTNVADLGVFGTCRGLGALAGALLFVRCSRKFGLERTVTAALMALGVGCTLPLADLPLPEYGVLWGLAWGFQETSYVTLAMSYARGHWSATLFAVFMIFSNLGTSLGEAVGAASARHWGFSPVFLGFGILAGLLAISMPRLLARQTK